MILHGNVRHGVIVLDEGEHLPDGARVAVIPEVQPAHLPIEAPNRQPADDRRRMLDALDRISALPIEGDAESFHGADHDRVLYGRP